MRILREEPDLVGELGEDPQPAGVEFVAYLATHGPRAGTARLRDAIGTARSRSVRTVWNAARFARRAVDADRVPQASGNQVYELSEEVTCDWMRFLALVELARQSAEGATARTALRQALELVEGVPGSASPRYGWLDEERLLSEITEAVLAAASRLATLELAAIGAGEGSREDVLFAIRKGRLLSPRAPELEERLDGGLVRGRDDANR